MRCGIGVVKSLNKIFFFFQAEDGIRDYKVTGVQTCALPIYGNSTLKQARGRRSHWCRHFAASARRRLQENRRLLQSLLGAGRSRPETHARAADRKSVV